MKINLALWDRILRFLLGFLLTAWAAAGGPWWAYFGIYLVFSSSFGLCPIYGLLKIRTADVDERPWAPPE